MQKQAQNNLLMYTLCLIAGEIALYSIAGEENCSNQLDPLLTGFENQTYESLQSPKRSNDDFDETYDELNRNR